MKLLHLFVEFSSLAFRTCYSLSSAQHDTEEGQSPLHQDVQSGLNLRGRSGGINSDIDKSSDQGDLFLTAETVGAYGYLLKKYLSTKGCFHSSSDIQIPKKKMHHSCAVVGASPNSHDSKDGSEIDGHDAVLRAGICNAEVLQNYSNDIGIKTTYCVSFSEKSNMAADVKWILPLQTWNFLQNVNLGSQAHMCAKRLLIGHPLLIRQWEHMVDGLVQRGFLPPSAPSTESEEDPVRSWRAQSHYLDPECLAQGKESSCPKILGFSSGFEAVLFARELCHSVDVYGFDVDERLDAAYGHLHDNVTTKAAPCVVGLHSHPFPLERNLLKYWDSQGVIHLASSVAKQSVSELGRHTSRDVLRKDRSRLS
jgi:hypothetical protein|mmetsp:Transcript_66854/g.105755  ORF Transcript_66854/g.105755 Transcript_66854/m.105755 type:complete len:366 (+) Transcript_66854:31-1128(+)